MQQIAFALIILAILMTACAAAPEEAIITVEEPWARTSMMPMDMGEGEMSAEEGGHMAGNNSAAYMVIRNEGKEPDRLVGVASDVAEFVEMHTSEMREGVMTMTKVEGIDIPARGEAVLEPGALHIMFINLNRDLKEGESVTILLQFEKSGQKKINAEVRPPVQ